MMRTLSPQALTYESFNSAAGSRREARREIRSFCNLTCLAQ